MCPNCKVVWSVGACFGGEMYKQLWRDDRGQDIAEYALMLAILLTIVVAVLQTIGKNETALFSQAASKLAAAM